MKTVIKSLLLGLSLFAAFCALLFVSASAVEARPLGNENKVITAVRHAAFITSTGQAIKVNVEKPAGEALQVSFVNKNGSVLADQFVGKQAGSYTVKFNVEQLPDGDYKIRIVGKETLGEYNFTLKTPEVAAPARTLVVQ